jgi:antitoxin component YwqK of YwqJK toxin-antitoxin module
MKNLFLVGALILFFTNIQAQHIEGDKGKTYYDSAKTKVKEIYTYSESFDPMTMKSNGTKKDGAYFKYFENGKLEITGYYKKDKKSGLWKYYDIQGNIVRTENYLNGELVE